jgi:hypothetical protein
MSAQSWLYEPMTVDQEVAGSNPPSCTSNNNNLADSCRSPTTGMSALCPHSQCRVLYLGTGCAFLVIQIILLPSKQTRTDSGMFNAIRVTSVSLTE